MSGTGTRANTQGFPQNDAPVVDPGRNYQWTTFWLRFMMSLWARTGAAQGGVTPTGQITAFGSLTIPAGWLVCDGTAVDRTVYAALFTVIGTTYGAGDGSTTFNLPNLQDRFPMGAGVHSVGTPGGSTSVTLSVGNLPSHTHTITDPGHAHSTFAASSTNTAGSAAGSVTSGGMTGTATTGITATDATGSGTSFSVLPPFQAIVWMIKS